MDLRWELVVSGHDMRPGKTQRCGSSRQHSPYFATIYRATRRNHTDDTVLSFCHVKSFKVCVSVTRNTLTNMLHLTRLYEQISLMPDMFFMEPSCSLSARQDREENLA